jgi:hypothetical protein
MTPRNPRVLVFAAALLTASLAPAWSRSQEPTTPPPPQEATPPQQATPPAPPPSTPPPATPSAPQAPAPAPQAGPKIVKPEEIGISFAPPQGWQEGDPTKFTLPGDICCAWSPDNVASIVAFVQRPGRPLNPKVLLEQSAKALESALGAEVKVKEVKDIGGLRGFSLVVTAAGNGAAIDGKGTVPTTQHWIGIPREQDVIVFLMTTPDAAFAQNEQVFQGLLGTLKVSGTQTPEQQQASM